MTNFYKDKQQITNWLDKYQVKNYTLIPDDKYGFMVCVGGDINLTHKELDFIPVKFSNVDGYFYCGDNKLTSLEFSPQTVVGSFYCGDNKLTSLELSPKTVGDDFICWRNKLTSLEFCPQKVSGSFYCNDNSLISLEFCPQTVGGKFYFYENPELKDFQNINNFNLIYLEHKKILITKFSNKLNKKLPNENSKNSTKIKI